MYATDFAHVTNWVFDLDNTLYPPSARLFELIEVRMTAYVMQSLGVDRPEADRLRNAYWQRYGTTLAGLMREHGVDPGPYLTEVHEISLAALQPDPVLRAQIAALPGRRFVFTNGSSSYAGKVLEARGLAGIFDGIYGVEHAGFHPKPDAAAYAAVFARAEIAPERAAMFEDDPRNLKVPHALGMRCVHVAETAVEAPHIDHHTSDLAGFLANLRR
ncbi:pyrimidine 5'-nucleotidase [Phaeovulum sp.]|uniref:pyrimidine 5'-nucleotidase n=1 Tax=Phaeovulum sp. TaxID=2934796 RepID=UPI00273132A1|nr:pyrimidine 5'-nucleotidase [Phaeovulum sp.]MDP1668472.1 pyrimidine 5'-nucleotidase [Phaeovulum sp.]MDZ4118915.1 pyrimidine 5'-nucleotidase [Phaeovulum sp.]